MLMFASLQNNDTRRSEQADMETRACLYRPRVKVSAFVWLAYVDFLFPFVFMLSVAKLCLCVCVVGDDITTYCHDTS